MPDRARPRSQSVLVVAALCALLWPLAARAQDGPQIDSPAHVAFVDGTAVIERDGKADNAPANMPLLAGDRIRTETGRVEILYADGSTLHLDNFTTVDFQSEEVVRLLDGRIRLTIAGRPRDLSYRLDAPNGWAHITQPGEYRLALMRREGNVEVELAVLRGSAELVNDDGRTPLRAGERAFARAGAAPSYAYVFNSATWDAFDRWSEGRRDDRLGLSSQYLPESVRPYSRTFDTYGSWRHEPTYGYVWYPRVAVGWRPYYYGRWVTLRPYGWTWVGTDYWAWPTHHYGRWGFSAGSWFWIPGRTWGPAWVSWAYAPGYVSWCPLGWNNRPVFSLVNINIYGGRSYDHWRAWTVIPRHHFGYDYVHRRVISVDRIDARVRGSFAVRDSGPEITGYAVPRSTAPIRTVGRAIPRGGGRSDAPIYTNRSAEASRVDSNGRRIQVDSAPRPGAPDRDPRSRAVPRSGDTEAPRMIPERGVRSMPSRRADAGDIGDAERPQRAMPREAAPRDDSATPVRPREIDREPAYRRAPVTPREPAEPSINRREPAPDRGESPVYRSTPVPERAPDTPYRRRPAPGMDGPRSEPTREPSIRAMPRREPESPRPSYEPPRERRGPDGPPPGMRAIPRGEAPPRSTDAPPPSRTAPPSRTRPGGGDGDAGPARRRRDS